MPDLKVHALFSTLLMAEMWGGKSGVGLAIQVSPTVLRLYNVMGKSMVASRARLLGC